MPMEDLVPGAIRNLDSFGIKASKTEQIIKSKDPILQRTIDEAIKRVNESAVSRAAYVQKWIFLPRDFSLGGGELGNIF